ncbi:hypothetical protein MASR2M48_22550 [Spirochaetota bacterium]
MKNAYALRDTRLAGGLIFYDKGSYSDGWRYLEVAPVSTELTGIQWGKSGTLINATAEAIGTGKNNTELILAVLNAAPADSDRAAQLCDALTHEHDGTTYSDWFLPSKLELNAIWVNIVKDGSGANSGAGGFCRNLLLVIV